MSARSDGSTKHHDILLISVDTLRHDHLSLYGYPRPTSPQIDAFFEDAEIYTRAYSAEAATTPSVVSMLTGQYPQRHGVRLLYQLVDEKLPTLPNTVAKHGYETAGVVSNIVLTSEASALDKHFNFYDDFVDERELNRDTYERRAERTTDAAIHWLEHRRDPDKNHFLWVHYIDPHGPYTPPSDKPKAFSHDEPHRINPRKIRKYQRIDGVTDGRYYQDRYDEEIAYTDREVGRLLGAYEAAGLAEDAIIVFTADHGETMLEYNRYFTHGYHVWEPIMHVPLMISRPGAESREIDKPVSLVDLMPTLLDYVGIEFEEMTDGYTFESRPTTSPISLEASTLREKQRRALLWGARKWYATVDSQGEVTERWYTDISDDPTEKRHGPWPGTPVERVLNAWIATDPDPAGLPADLDKGEKLDGPKVAPGRTPEQLKALRALGYVE